MALALLLLSDMKSISMFSFDFGPLYRSTHVRPSKKVRTGVHATKHNSIRNRFPRRPCFFVTLYILEAGGPSIKKGGAKNVEDLRCRSTRARALQVNVIQWILSRSLIFNDNSQQQEASEGCSRWLSGRTTPCNTSLITTSLAYLNRTQ